MIDKATTKLPLAVHSRRRSSLNSGGRSSLGGGNGAASPPAEDETIVEPDQGNVLSHIISQLRPGADLSRVVLPTFILEPRSMLERITNFMAHPETLLPMSEIDDPLGRFVAVVKFYLSGWHIRPPGVKKPLNPILGETYTCYWDYPDGTRGYYIAEQTSHHPPKSSYFFMAPEHHIRIDGTLKPRSRFLGNSAASLMEGIAILQLLNRGKNGKGEKYIVTQPNMYARGILFGKMKYELGDHSYVRCAENNLVADLEFKVKGYFMGTYNAIGGNIRNEATGEVFYELSGFWNGEMFIKDMATGQSKLLFDATNAKHTPPQSRPFEELEERESQRLWSKTVEALHAKNHDLATDEKTKIEEQQRVEAAQRVEDGTTWRPKLFREVEGGPGGPEEGEEDLDWILDSHIDHNNPERAIQQILSVAPILQGQQRASPKDNEADSNQSEPPPQNDSQNTDSLIDFGDDNDQVSPAQGTTSNPKVTAASQGLLDESSDDNRQTNPSGTKQPDLMAPLQPTLSPQRVKRMDSKTSDVDEFTDARS